jgi:hypothetical protein
LHCGAYLSDAGQRGIVVKPVLIAVQEAIEVSEFFVTQALTPVYDVHLIGIPGN